jgi:Na+/proline symporter
VAKRHRHATFETMSAWGQAGKPVSLYIDNHTMKISIPLLADRIVFPVLCVHFFFFFFFRQSFAQIAKKAADAPAPAPTQAASSSAASTTTAAASTTSAASTSTSSSSSSSSTSTISVPIEQVRRKKKIKKKKRKKHKFFKKLFSFRMKLLSSALTSLSTPCPTLTWRRSTLRN